MRTQTLEFPVRARLPRVVRVAVVSLLMIGSMPLARAQLGGYISWDTTLTFTGTGEIQDVLGNLVPTTVTMTGTGVNTATSIGSGAYAVTSSFNVSSLMVDITGADAVAPDPYEGFGSPPPFDISGSGISLTAPPGTLPADPGSPPYYGLFPPASGAGYSGTVADSSGYGFFFEGDTLIPQYASFNGPVDFLLGSGPSGIDGTFTYADSVLQLDVLVQSTDPIIDFYGDAVITTSAAITTPPVPDSSSPLLDALLLLSVCAAVGRSRAAEAKPARVRSQK
jgi:hypothetical protein